MVLLYKKHHLYKKTHVRGHSGGSLLSYVPTLVGNLLSKVDYSNIAKTLGGLAVGSVASYGVNKAIEHYTSKNDKIATVTPEPPKLTIAPAPQGTISGDILPVKNIVEKINPANSSISLTDGYVKNVNEIVPKSKKERLYSGGNLKKRKSGGNINKILTNKSKDILKGLLK